MANSKVKVTFDCLRVDIDRPWLRPELFYDDGLIPAGSNTVSPGPMVLTHLMDPASYVLPAEIKATLKGTAEDQLNNYNLFPMYPTAFLLAANVVLEVEGETADLQSHFESASYAGSVDVGFGPFQVSGSTANTESHASSSSEATASGMR